MNVRAEYISLIFGSCVLLHLFFLFDERKSQHVLYRKIPKLPTFSSDLFEAIKIVMDFSMCTVSSKCSPTLMSTGNHWKLSFAYLMVIIGMLSDQYERSKWSERLFQTNYNTSFITKKRASLKEF